MASTENIIARLRADIYKNPFPTPLLVEAIERLENQLIQIEDLKAEVAAAEDELRWEVEEHQKDRIDAADSLYRD